MKRLVAWAVSGWLGLAASDRLMLVRGPTPYCLVPCTQEIIVRVTPHEDNWSYSVTVDGPLYYTSDTRSLLGAPPAQRPHLFRDLPEGMYLLTIELSARRRGRLDVIARVSTTFEVR